MRPRSLLLRFDLYLTMVLTMVKKVPKRTMPISEFRAKCLALMDEVAETGLSIVITRRGVPVGQIEPTTDEERRLFYEGKLEEWKQPVSKQRRVRKAGRR